MQPMKPVVTIAHEEQKNPTNTHNKYITGKTANYKADRARLSTTPPRIVTSSAVQEYQPREPVTSIKAFKGLKDSDRKNSNQLVITIATKFE